MIDPVLGSGATVIVMLFLAGVVAGGVLIMLGMNMTNATHRSAGEDMTEFAGGMAKAQGQAFRVHQEYARLERETAGYDGKRGLLDHKELIKRAGIIADAQIEAERQAAAAQTDTKSASWMDRAFGVGRDVVDADPGGDSGQWYE